MKFFVKLINNFTISASMWIGHVMCKYNINNRLLSYIGYKLSKFYIVWR